MSLQTPVGQGSKEAGPLLSICIPTYNRAEILRKTLDHLHQVCDARVEIVVTDNASPDHTQRVIEEFRPRFRFFRTLRHEKNLGIFKNVSSAMSLATGKYLYTLSDDDVVLFDGLQTAIHILEREPDVVAVYGGYQEWDRTTDRVLGTLHSVESRTDFMRGDKIGIFNHFRVLWYPVCRTDIFQRFFTYDENSFGLWPLIGALLDHGNLAVIHELFYKHAHTEPRMEFELTEGWYHDCNRAQYEVYIGRLGSADPQQMAIFVNTRVGSAYAFGAHFAQVKNQVLKSRHFLLRARAYGFVEETIVMQWERQYMISMIAEKLLDQIELLPHIREILFDSDPKLEGVKNRFAAIASQYRIVTVPVDEIQATMLKPDQFLVTREYRDIFCRADDGELLRHDPTRYRAVEDLLESCRLTDQPLLL